MDKKLSDSLDDSLKEKLRNCKAQKELQDLFKAAGVTELSPEQLEGVSGGIDMPVLPDERIDCHGFFIS